MPFFFFLFNSFTTMACKSNNCEYGCLDDVVLEDLLILSSVKQREEELGFPLPEMLQIGIGTEIRLSANPSSYMGFPNQGILHEFQYEDILQTRVVEQFEQSQNMQDAFGSSHVFIDVETQNTENEEWLIVGSPEMDTDFFQEGAVSIFYNGVLRNTIYGIQAGKPIGNELILCPDWDGDFIDETIITNSHSTTEYIEVGSLYVLPSSSYLQTISNIEKLYTISGEQKAERFGFSMDCDRVFYGSEDIQSGNIQLLVGAPFASNELETQGRVGLYLPNGTQDGELIHLWGLEKDSWLGWTVSFGDLNGDGFTEIYAGAPGENENQGSIYVWDSSLYISQYPTLRILPSSETIRYGESFIVEDINDDGYDDLVIGNQYTENAEGFVSGAVEVIYGQSLSIIETLSVDARKSKTWIFDEKDTSIGRKLGIVTIGEQKFLSTTKNTDE
jgi:hypothetical protein